MNENNKYLTNAEAIGFMCPFREQKQYHCVGTDCMAWKWTKWSARTIPNVSKDINAKKEVVQYPTHGTCALIYREKTIHNLKDIQFK